MDFYAKYATTIYHRMLGWNTLEISLKTPMAKIAILYPSYSNIALERNVGKDMFSAFLYVTCMDTWWNVTTYFQSNP